ncbi:hypothetical protein ACTQW9_11840 [Lachnospiraceae bacterium LCP19S3_B12]
MISDISFLSAELELPDEDEEAPDEAEEASDEAEEAPDEAEEASDEAEEAPDEAEEAPDEAELPVAASFFSPQPASTMLPTSVTLIRMLNTLFLIFPSPFLCNNL